MYQGAKLYLYHYLSRGEIIGNKYYNFFEAKFFIKGVKYVVDTN
jgi:hypothetical protein